MVSPAVTLRDIAHAPRLARDIPRAHLQRWTLTGLVERAHDHIRITPAGREHLAATAFPRAAE